MSELLRATIALQDDSIHMLEAENKRLTARLRAESAEVDKLVNRLQESEDDNGRLQAKVEQLEGALFGSNGALTRMDRARKILNDRHGFDNWNVLNTDDIKAALKGDT